MTHKANSGKKTKMPDGKVSIRFVKSANMWCKTWFEDGQQKQEWFEEKPKDNK